MEPRLRALYICYLSLEDPLVHTQVVAYLEGLAQRGHTIHLMTFDPELRPSRRRSIRDDLRGHGIEWHSLRYHKRPSLPATVYDAFTGALAAVWIVRRHRLEAVHARNHVPAAAALVARRATGCRLIFDVRGLMAEEYVDAGRWERGGLPYRLTRSVQRATLRRADGLVVLTQAVRPRLLAERAGRDATFVIPCCADLDRLDDHVGERESVRAELAIGDRPVMVYSGKFTGWYMEREMADFFAVARRSLPKLLFLVLTQADPSPLLSALERHGFGPGDHRVLRAEPDEIGRYLSAADFGISFIRPSFSKISSSPTKVGEYLGAGLPVVSSAGIGDIDALVGGHPVGTLVEDFSERGYAVATGAISTLLADPSVSERCRAVAREELSLREVGIPRYDELYRRVALSPGPT